MIKVKCLQDALLRIWLCHRKIDSQSTPVAPCYVYNNMCLYLLGIYIYIQFLKLKNVSVNI